MPITQKQGLTSAISIATHNRKQYGEVSRIYGPAIDMSLGEVPRVLALSHVLRVNPKLRILPNYTVGQYRGFMRVSVEATRHAGVDWNRLQDPNLCAYVWLRYLNYNSNNLYTQNPRIFQTPNETFWRCAYLQDAVENTAFKYLWSQANITSDTDAYDQILYVVLNNTKTIGSVSPEKLATLVLKDCEFVFQMSKIIRGSIQSVGAGKEPIPPTCEISAFFTQGKVSHV